MLCVNLTDIRRLSDQVFDLDVVFNNNYEDTFWAGIFVPAGTPMPIVPKLNAAINDIVGSGDMQANLDKISAKSQLGSPQQFAEFMAAQTKTWSEIVKAGDIKAD
jgi:tripartite-type tricarboxylate transporter receptor subunit TctC